MLLLWEEPTKKKTFVTVFFKVLVQTFFSLKYWFISSHFRHNESQYDDYQSGVEHRLHWRRWWMRYIPSINLIYCLWHSAVLKMQNFVKHARRSFRAKSKIRNKSWPVITISRGIKQVVFYIKNIRSRHHQMLSVATFFMVYHDGGEGFIRSSIPDTILGSDAMVEVRPE